MMMKNPLRYFGVALAVVLAIALTGCGSASSGTNADGVKSSGVLRIGTTDNTKPYTYEDNGVMTGFDVDLMTAVAGKLGLKPQFSSMDFSGLLPAVNNNQFDVAAAAIGITAPRQQVVDFSEGYLAGYFGVLSPKTSGITHDVGSVQGKKIAVLQGSIEDANSSTFIPGAQIVRFPDQNSAFMALQQHRVDGFFNDFDPNQALIAKNPSMDLVQSITLPATAFPAGWAVKKGNTALAAKLNQGLKEVVADGTWLKLYKKYFPNDPVPTSAQLPPYKTN